MKPVLDSLGYRPDVDGLRALAVLSVCMFHLDLLGMNGGYVGVDVFFVISGYLIGRQIIEWMQAGEFSFVDFYERRARRLAGPLLIVLAVSYGIGVLVLMPIDLTNLSKSVIRSVFFLANHYFYSHLDYFNSDAYLNPLLHLWSLSVEEQFYVFFPLLVFLSIKWSGGLMPLLALGVGSLAGAALVAHQNESAAFFFLPFRGWELLLGLAVYIVEKRQPLLLRLREILSVIGIALIAYPIFAYSDATVFPGLSAVGPTIGTALLIYSNAHGDSILGSLLSSAPLVFIGKLSYSLYLWHWPLIVYARYYLDRPTTAMEAVVILVVAFALSYLSFVFLETRLRRRQARFSRAETLLISLMAAVLLGLLAYPGVRMQGYPERIPKQAKAFASARLDWGQDQFRCVDKSVQAIVEGELCAFGARNRGVPRVLLWGDSHATAMLPPLQAMAQDGAIALTFAGTNGCPPIMGVETNKGYCTERNSAVGMLLRTQKFDVVVLASAWNSYGKSNWISISRDSLGQELANSVRTIIREGARVVLVGQVPSYTVDIPNWLAKRAYLAPLDALTGYVRALPEPKFEPSYFEQAVAVLRGDVTKVVMPREVLCTENACRLTSGSYSLYKDASHLSMTGSHILRDALRTALTAHSLPPATADVVDARLPD